MALMSKYIKGSTGGSDWYAEAKTPQRLSYWTGKYGEQKPWRNKQTGETGETVKAKYYKLKTLDELLGTKYGLGKITTMSGEKPPEEKKKPFSALQWLGRLVGATSTAPVAAKWLEAKAKGEKFGFGKFLGEYGKSFVKGIKGEERGAETYKEILDKLGWRPKTKGGQIARGVAGFAGDVLLDPLTYVSAGVGKGVTVGGKVLSRAGSGLFKKAVKQYGVEAAERMVKTALKKPELATKYIAKGGIKFAGIPIVPESVTKGIGKYTGLTAAKEAIRGTKPVQALGKAFFREFRPGGVSKEQFGKFKDILQSEYYSKHAYEQARTLDTIENLFKKVKPGNRQKITRALMEGKIASLPKNLQQPAKGVRSLFGSIAKEEKQLGILQKTRKDYVTQLYKNPIKAREVLGRMPDQLTKTTRFAKARSFEDLSEIPQFVLQHKKLLPEGSKLTKKESMGIIFGEKGKLANGLSYGQVRKEIEKVGLTPKLDVAELAATRLKSSKEAVTNRELLKKVGQEMGRKPKDLLWGDDFVKYESKNVGDVAIPRFAAEHLKNLETKAINDEGIKGLLSGWNKIQNWYKKSLTSIFPSFHARNAFSNVALNYLDIGVDSLNPISHIDALKGLKGGKGILKTKGGRQYTFSQVRDLMRRHNIVGTGFYEGEAKKLFGEKLGGIVSPKKIAKLSPFRVGRQVGKGIESEARAVNFISNLKKGLSADEAAKRTKQFLFDYDNLSQFEKKVMRTFIPFYTFSRKNLELQLKMLKERPGRVAAEIKAIRGIGEPITEKEKEKVPEFIQEQLGVKMGTDKYGRPIYYSGFGMPIEEAAQKISQGPLQTIGQMMSPMIKAPIEKLTGKDIFRRRDIKDIYKADDIKFLVDKLPKESQGRVAKFLDLRSVEKAVYAQGKKVGTETEWRADPEKLWMLRQLPTSRLQTTLGYIGSEDMDDRQKALKMLSGVKGFAIDEEEQAYFKQKEEMDALIGMLKRYGVLGQEPTGQPYLRNEEKYLSQVLPSQNQKAPTSKYERALAMIGR